MGQIYFGDPTGKWVRFESALTIEYRAKIEAQPLMELKAELVRELTLGRSKMDTMRAEVDKLQDQHAIAAQLASLDKTTIQSFLLSISRPTRTAVWIERLIAFASGVVASLVASVLYDLGKR